MDSRLHAFNPNETSRDPKTRGPLPPYPTHYSCIQEVTYYTDRLGAMGRLPDGDVIQGSLSDDPCSHGHFLFTPIPGTNLYLLVLDQYEDLSSSWNLNCHILNRVQLPSAMEVSHGTCDAEFAPILYRRARTCNNTHIVSVDCGYSAATWCHLSELLVLVMVVMHMV